MIQRARAAVRSATGDAHDARYRVRTRAYALMARKRFEYSGARARCLPAQRAMICAERC